MEIFHYVAHQLKELTTSNVENNGHKQRVQHITTLMVTPASCWEE